jgi:hypothetical protein
MQGDGAGRKTTTVRRKRRGIGGIGLTQQTRYIGTNNTLQGRELHESREWGRAAVSVAYDSPEAMERRPARSDGKRQLGDDIIDVREFDLVMPHLRVPDLASY